MAKTGVSEAFTRKSTRMDRAKERLALADATGDFSPIVSSGHLYVAPSLDAGVTNQYEYAYVERGGGGAVLGKLATPNVDALPGVTPMPLARIRSLMRKDAKVLRAINTRDKLLAHLGVKLYMRKECFRTRKAARGGEKRLSAYNTFIKDGVAAYKREHPEVGHRDAFRAVALTWAQSNANPKNSAA